MGVLDKFLNAMKLNDDDGFQDDDYLDDEYEGDFEEERPKKRILKEKYEDEEDLPKQASLPQERPQSLPKARPKAVKPAASSKISPMRAAAKRQGGSSMEVCVIKPRSMEDAREITETLEEECTVILNMEGLDLELAQRLIDFSSGSCYALHGSLQKISNYIFIITPQSVDISGDFQEILNGAVDVPTFGARF